MGRSTTVVVSCVHDKGGEWRREWGAEGRPSRCDVEKKETPIVIKRGSRGRGSL